MNEHVLNEHSLNEHLRADRLLDAQAKAAELFAAIETRGIITAGVREVQASDAIRDLAADLFGMSSHWHKRIVRAGPNTLQPYRENPPDRVITGGPSSARSRSFMSPPGRTKSP